MPPFFCSCLPTPASRLMLVLAFVFSLCPAHAQGSAAAWEVGAAIDAAAGSRALALGSRDRGLGLGHSDLSASGPLGSLLEARITAVAHTREQRLETEFEEVWAQTRALPAGWQVRAGRFLSQIGYLNEQHPHTDDFVQRPLLHRAFLGNHWSDDGLRVNWTAPTATYLRLGMEAFRGRALVQEATGSTPTGAMTFSARSGGDIGRSQSWQAGLSFLHNRREAVVEDHDESHDHGHGAVYSGRRMWLADIAWKWAPEGNNRREQVRIAYEHAVVTGINRYATSSDRHQAGYLSAVWRFAPTWELGVRTDSLRARAPHEDSFEDKRLRERALMVAWKPTHQQTLRLQVTQQRDRAGFSDAARAVQIQYILNLGAHAAHSY
ncbi:MAG: hypothetical protein RL522_1424 [Pseudomonadota bacterium]